MPNRQTDSLFQLIKSLEKSEKRNFKLYVKRNSGGEDLKVVQLFDALDKMDMYDEEQLLKKNKGIQKKQLSNIKAHLYKQLLNSLRLIKNEDNIDLLLHEQMDYARILYNKGLYLQSLKILDRMKDMAEANNQFTYLQQVRTVASLLRAESAAMQLSRLPLCDCSTREATKKSHLRFGDTSLAFRSWPSWPILRPIFGKAAISFQARNPANLIWCILTANVSR